MQDEVTLQTPLESLTGVCTVQIPGNITKPLRGEGDGRGTGAAAATQALQLFDLGRPVWSCSRLTIFVYHHWYEDSYFFIGRWSTSRFQFVHD